MKDYWPLIQTALWIALILFAVLMFRKPLLERIERGASLKVGPLEIGALEERVKDVQQEVSDLAEKVAKIFLFAMPSTMYSNLKKLGSGNFESYEMSLGLERELYHLRDMRYIRVEPIKSIPTQGANLSDHVKITDTGHRFVEMRDSMMSL